MKIVSILAIAITISTSLVADYTIASETPIIKPAITTQEILLADNSDKQDLNNNECLKSLSDNDKIIVSAAFHEGAGGFRQLQELLDREPWGYVADPVMQQELDTLVKQQSPFLIATMTKKQALLLESHRDLIKWILVQSTEKACA